MRNSHGSRRDNPIINHISISENGSDLGKLLQRHRDFFDRGETRSIGFRIEQLKKLRKAISSHYSSVLDALDADMKKPRFEAYESEIALLYQEIDHAMRKVKRWAKPHRVKTPLLLSPASSRVVPEPYGVVLIIAPWNYPFQLAIAPLIGAIAAGNTAVLKPSELAPHTSHSIAEIIRETFDSSYISAVEGGADTAKRLLSERFDYIFFTGGTATGRLVMEAASRHLTPVTLELGGKSPVIVARDASIDSAAKKIVWGKFINAGQTCLAPDYILAHEDIKEALLERMSFYIQEFYGEDPQSSTDYARIVNEKHFQRINRLLGRGNIRIGGGVEESDRYIAPTIVDGITIKDPVMGEEIFGPVLPVLGYSDLDEAISMVKSLPKPLALYLFTDNKKTRNRVIHETSSGGVCVNDTLLHVGNYNLPFGGVGDSGIGAYHGKTGFDTFSHMKSVLRKRLRFDIPLRYPPYRKGVGLLRRIFE
jgi:aldehyde dehydrogenase (NAD+)